MLGQSPSFDALTSYDVRLRTTETDVKGKPSLTSPEGVVRTSLTHVVYTRDAFGERRLYVDSVLVMSGVIGGDFSAWNSGYRLTLGSDWPGLVHMM